jgi:hypothetical protein
MGCIGFIMGLPLKALCFALLLRMFWGNDPRSSNPLPVSKHLPALRAVSAELTEIRSNRKVVRPRSNLVLQVADITPLVVDEILL